MKSKSSQRVRALGSKPFTISELRMRNPLELIVRPIYTIYVLKYLKEKEGGKMEGTVEKKIIVRRLNR